MAKKSLAKAQLTNLDGFPKPGELIELTGAHELEAADRAIMNLLYQHAHDSGRVTDEAATWEISMSSLRFGEHRGKARISDSLDRLMRVVVTVPLPDPKTGEPRSLKTHLFDFFDLSADEGTDRATVRFGLPRKLQPVLLGSSRWGRIKAEVVCAMTSKYAIALYEMVQLRANLDRCLERFPIDRFRDLMGVPPGTYDRGNDFERFVLLPATLEVNGLSDMGVRVDLLRRGSKTKTPIEAVLVGWWPKGADELRAVYRERNASKVGRMARLRGTAERTLAPPEAPRSRQAAILAELDARNAPDRDYRAAFSTGAKVALRRGETWRDRLAAWVDAERALAPSVALPGGVGAATA